MSHLKERKEKTCLNCGTDPLYGRYCHVCGQENLEPQETVWHLANHFFEDVTHFDGKFFSTVKYLLKRPGFLSTEYMVGRRASYLNPIRMYVFTSAIFFLVLFSLKSSQWEHVNINSTRDISKRVVDSLKKADDSEKGVNVVVLYNAGWDPSKFRSAAAYDSVQSGLPDTARDGWMKRLLMKRLIATNEEYHKDKHDYGKHLVENLLHSFPKILFFSLPFVALILKLLYIRRKQYLYADHGIFTIHLYCATFLLMLANVLLGEFSNRVDWPWLQTVCNLLIFAIVLYMFVYLFMAMRGFYRQGWGKTLLKYILLGALGLGVNFILFMLFALISAIWI